MNAASQQSSIDATRALVKNAVAVIRAALPDFTPKVLIILGSGLGAVVKDIKRIATLNYSEIPGFFAPTVESHAGKLILGEWNGCPVAVMAGRFHLYEGHAPQDWIAPIRALHELGCETLLVTNAAGALHEDLPIPSLMMITDHINGLGKSPLQGPNDAAIGVRFPDMTEVYDPALRAQLRAAAQELDLPLGEGVYFGTLGPTFETAAEVRMMATLGGDAVGMSTISEVIVARHCGMRIVGISSITNATAGVATMPQTMDEVMAGGAALSQDLARLIGAFLSGLTE